MRTTIDPPLHSWTPRSSTDAARFAALHVARDPITGKPVEPGAPTTIIASGHQASLWHPGILAKYIALDAAATQHGAAALNVIVDHDVYEPLRIELPRVDGDTASARTIHLARVRDGIPPRMQPPVDGREVITRIEQARAEHGDALAADLIPLIEAWRDLPPADHLADQMAFVLGRLMRPYAGTVPFVLATDLMTLAPAREWVARMLGDAAACVRAYNASIDVAPGAGIRPLHVGVDLVELPLWLLHTSGRLPVFARMNGTSGLHLVTQRGPVDADIAAGEGILAPRALMLTAVMRSVGCDLFIHGKGGGVYDRITDAWMERWAGVTLAPMAVVSADLYRDFDVPIADQADVVRAVWYDHYLPHNVDRELDLAGDLIDEKSRLLHEMDSDRDAVRRAAAFARIHAINDTLAADHPEAIKAARDALARARQGRANRAVSRKRDWCFATYPPEQLRGLGDAIHAAAGSASPPPPART